MKKIGEKGLFGFKNSNTIIVYGSGYSINKLKKKDFQKLSRYDSIGFNWFCKSNIPTTFYVIREQCNNNKRKNKDENLDIFYKNINNHYRKSCFIVHRLTYDTKKYKLYDHSKHLDRIKGVGIVVRDVHAPSSIIRKRAMRFIKKFNNNILDEGIQHGLCTMYSIMHFITFMKYKRVIFSGVDLNNCRYFWLRRNQRRHTLLKKNKDVDDKHPVYKNTMKLLSLYQKVFPKVEMKVYNKGSALVRIMGVYNHE